MDKKKIIIIGGGISGLSAGINAINNGFEPLIIEKNPRLGGLCIGWQRKGYNIDGCIHWITGTRKDTQLHKMWQDIGAFKDEEIFDLPSWGSVEYQGEIVPFYSDISKAEEAWIKISPKDKKRIHKFFKMVRIYEDVELPNEDPIPFLSYKTLFSFLWKMIKYFPTYEMGMFMSCEKYAKRFSSPALRYALTHIQPGKGNLYSMVFSYCNIASKNGGIIKGGSDKMIANIVEKYRSLGGELISGVGVKSIDIEKHKAVGVILEDGRSIKGDYVISCCDVNYTLADLLDNKYYVRKFARRYNHPDKNPAPGCVLVYFAIEDMVDIPVPYMFDIPTFILGEEKIDHLCLRKMDYDPLFVKDNKVVVQVLLDQSSAGFNFWDKLGKNPADYKEYKANLASFIEKLIVEKFPSLQDKITFLDMTTPLTYKRYVNASRGSYMGFLYTDKKMALMSKGKVPHLKNFYLCGQYVQSPGGLPLALTAGHHVICHICYHEQKRFIRFFHRFKLKFN